MDSPPPTKRYELTSQPFNSIISIIVPVYNAERFLSATLHSIQDQTYQNFECLLVLDAKSSDRSLEIAKDFAAQDPRFQVIQGSKNLGVSNNRNVGIDCSKGEYIAFLDSDDTWPAEKLSRQLEFSLQKNVDFSFTSFQRMSEDGMTLSAPTKVPPTASYDDLLKLNMIACHTVLLKRSFLGAHRFPNTVHEDFALWLELLRPRDNKKPIAYGLNVPLAFYRSVKGSRANNKKNAALWRWKILRDFEQLSLLKAGYYFLQYAFRASLLHLRTKVS